MKNLLKYLLPLAMIVTFCNVAGRSVSSSHQDSFSGFPTDEVTFADYLSAPVSELNLPGQISLSCSARLHGNARRTVSIHRSAVEFVKSGKAFNISVFCSAQRKSVIINTSVIEHAHKLVYLGKLII